MAKYVNFRSVREKFDVCPQTLKNWALRGKINYRAIQNESRKTWLYDINSIGNHIQATTGEISSEVANNATVIYARVSSPKQKEDLQRQISLLATAYPDGEVVSDVASGLSYTRHGFTKLVERICRGEIARVVVTYRDRLLRFGYELFEKMCQEHACTIVVYSHRNELPDIDCHEDIKELQEDLLSIVNVFVARRNGKRAGALKRERNKLKKEASELTNKSESVSEYSSEDSSQ